MVIHCFRKSNKDYVLVICSQISRNLQSKYCHSQTSSKLFNCDFRFYHSVFILFYNLGYTKISVFRVIVISSLIHRPFKTYNCRVCSLYFTLRPHSILYILKNTRDFGELTNNKLAHWKTRWRMLNTAKKGEMVKNSS